MRHTWRFYSDADGKWRWQTLNTDRSLISESSKGFDTYDACLAAAKKHGYVFEATQARLKRPGNANLSGAR
jgi:hypothetical protein